MNTRNRHAVLPPTVDALCALHRNEEPHARKVAALAIQLFDAVRGPLGLHRRDRRLLETAARLHDIGYAVAPGDHVAAGISLIREQGLRGFTPAQLDELAAIIALHGPPPLPADAAGVDERAPPSQRILQLGALLRVADALDHSHLQDTRILRVAFFDGMIRVRVSIPDGSLCAERAMAKSDLWQQIFPVGLVLEPVRRKRRAAFSPDEPARPAIRRLLLLHYNVLRTAARRAARDDDEEALHDLRLAVRALRRLLEAFARPLRDTSAVEAAEQLRSFAKMLGPARDLDVWVGLLERPRFAGALAEAPAFLPAQHRLQAAARNRLRHALNEGPTRALFSQLGYMLRIELLQDARGDAGPIGFLARKAVRAAWRDIRKQRALARRRKPAALHAFQILLRKLRILANLVQPALGPAATDAIDSVHALERTLGRIHDLDEGLARAEGEVAPRALVLALARRRRKELRRFRTAWDDFRKSGAARRCSKTFNEIAARA